MFIAAKAYIGKISDYLFNKYEWAISFLLKINFVKVNKEKYICKTVQKYYGKENTALVEQALTSSLANVLTEKQQRECYRRMMWRYGFIVFFISFALTLTPDELIYTIVFGALDLILFQCFLFIAMQKILLLYGTDCDLEKDESKSVETLISIDSSGLMIGKYPLLQKMKSVLGWLGKQIVKRIGPKIVAKASSSAFIVVRRQAIKWFSISIAKDNVNIALEAIIPFTCALISGLVSAVIFIPMCNKLKKHLIQNSKTQICRIES